MGESELSIRMEGGLERLLALGDGYTQTADALGKLELAEAAILRSRVDALISEEPAHQKLWAQVARLQQLVTPQLRRQLEAVRAGRAALERTLTRLAPGPTDGALANTWAQVGPRLHLLARLARARRHFETNNRSRDHERLMVLGAGMFILPLLLTATLESPWFLVVAPVGWMIAAVGSLRSGVGPPAPCPYCGEDADWFDDLPRVRAELVRQRPRVLTDCRRCHMSGWNFDAAFSVVRHLSLAELEQADHAARRRVPSTA